MQLLMLEDVHTLHLFLGLGSGWPNLASPPVAHWAWPLGNLRNIVFSEAKLMFSAKTFKNL